MAGRVSGPVTHAIGVVPPPLNGMTLVTSKMMAQLGQTGRAEQHTVSGTDKGLRWTARKHAAFLYHLMATALRSRGRDRCYFIPDSGAGLWLNIPEALILRLGFSEVWLHHHVFSYAGKRDARMALILRILGAKARHIVLGQAMSEGLNQHYGAAGSTTLNNAEFVEDVPAPRTRNALSCVGFIGNITRDKGIGLFMDTLRQVQGETGSVEALIAGPIRDPELQAEIEAFCAERPDKRHWIGPVRGRDKQAFFDKIDVLLFPTLYANEALPVTIYEALAAGVPVMATDRGCIQEQLDGLQGVLPEAQFTEQAVARLAGWHASPDALSTASQTARTQYKTQLDAARSAAAHLVQTITRTG